AFDFFFQAEDGIRDKLVTGVQTCALPILPPMLTRGCHSNWRLNRYGSLLLALEADLLSDEEFLRIGRETKSIQTVITRLLELGQIGRASCRERVGMSGVVGAVRETTTTRA